MFLALLKEDVEASTRMADRQLKGMVKDMVMSSTQTRRKLGIVQPESVLGMDAGAHL